ncbi:MAG: hypothetical protein IPH62_00010 [Ignavibacteriae bacterium]|nr:hypothetical protein [Ignavibacteriota bacterium]
MKNIILIVFMIIIFSCKSENSEINSVNYPEIDTSTPDKTVKSYLKYSTWIDTSSINILQKFLLENRLKLYSTFIKEASDTLKNIENDRLKKNMKIFSENNSIDNVEIQSDSRAIVIVKTNSMTSGLDHEKVLIMEKYTLTKIDIDWLIENIESTCYSCDGTGKNHNYTTSLYLKHEEKCENCGGDGWQNSIYQNK